MDSSRGPSVCGSMGRARRRRRPHVSAFEVCSQPDKNRIKGASAGGAQAIQAAASFCRAVGNARCNRQHAWLHLRNSTEPRLI